MLYHDTRKNIYSSRNYKFINMLLVERLRYIMGTQASTTQVVLGVHSLEDHFWGGAGWEQGKLLEMQAIVWGRGGDWDGSVGRELGLGQRGEWRSWK